MNEKSLAFFSEKNRRFCQNCFFNFRRNFSRKNTFPEKKIFLSSPDIEWKFFGSVPENLQWGCQNRNLRVCGTSVKKGNFLNDLWSFYHILTSSWKLSTFCRVVFAGSSELHFIISQEHFEEKTFLRKLEVYLTISEVDHRNFNFLPRKFRRVVNTAYYVSMGPVLKKKVFWTCNGLFMTFMTFGFRGTFFQLFVDYFFPGFSKLHPKCSKEQTVENYYFLKKCKFLFLFSDFQLKFFGQLVNFFRPCCQNRLFRVPRNTLYLFENIVFFATCFNIEQEKFGLLSENLRPSCPNCSLCFHRNTPKKNTFLKKTRIFLKIFGNWVKLS